MKYPTPGGPLASHRPTAGIGSSTDVLFPAAAASLTAVSDLPQESLVVGLIISLGDANGEAMSQQGDNRT